MMSTTPRRNLLAVALVGALALAANVARAGEIDHYAPGVPSIRDFAMPDSGFYGLAYKRKAWLSLKFC
jgi:hypothetical protein